MYCGEDSFMWSLKYMTRRITVKLQYTSGIIFSLPTMCQKKRYQVVHGWYVFGHICHRFWGMMLLGPSPPLRLPSTVKFVRIKNCYEYTSVEYISRPAVSLRYPLLISKEMKMIRSCMHLCTIILQPRPRRAFITKGTTACQSKTHFI